MRSPEIFVIAGPNGAGKSTVAATLLPEHFPTERFLNADSIAKAIASDSPMEAGRIMLRRLRELREQAETYAFETTLAGKTYARFLRQAMDAGYLVHVIYIWLSGVELARSRVAERVQEGGHDVPAADIERRYHRGLKNFFDIYMKLADTWVLCDNSGNRLVIVARGRRNAEPIVYDTARYERIHDAAEQR